MKPGEDRSATGRLSIENFCPVQVVFPALTAPRLRNSQSGVAREVGVVAQAFFQIARQQVNSSIRCAPGGNAHRLVQVDLACVKAGITPQHLVQSTGGQSVRSAGVSPNPRERNLLERPQIWSVPGCCQLASGLIERKRRGAFLGVDHRRICRSRAALRTAIGIEGWRDVLYQIRSLRGCLAQLNWLLNGSGCLRAGPLMQERIVDAPAKFPTRATGCPLLMSFLSASSRVAERCDGVWITNKSD